jgi:CubicO group peptidase (beta-lactamase class C family)
VAFVQGDRDQQAHQRLRHRRGQEARRRAAAVSVTLQHDRAILDHQQARHALVGQVVVHPAPHAFVQVAEVAFGYGYQFWTFPGARRRFALLGVRGQSIFVDPDLKLVLVQTAVWKSAGDRQARAELLALWRGIVEQYGAL